MMKYIKGKLIIFVLLSCFGTTITHAQNGFLGRKNTLELSGMINIPILSGSFNEDNYYVRGTELRARKDWFDFGARLQYSRLIKSRFAIGLSTYLKSYEVFADRSFKSSFVNVLIGNYTQNTNIRAQGTRIHTYSFLPTFIFTPNGSVNGTGISHEFGIGYSFSRVRERAYYYSLNETTSLTENWTPADIYILEADWTRYHSLTLQYGVHLRIPITNYLHMKFGSTCLINVYRRPDFDEVSEPQVGFFSHRALFFNLQRENAFSWNANAGLVYCF